MKAFTLIVFNLILISAFGQQKNDKVITVTLSDSALFNRVALVLIERGHTLKQKDKELGFISTDQKNVNNSLMLLKVIIKDTTATITGSLFNDIYARMITKTGPEDFRNYTEIKNIGMKGSGARDCWNEMDAVAKAIGGSITYSK